MLVWARCCDLVHHRVWHRVLSCDSSVRETHTHTHTSAEGDNVGACARQSMFVFNMFDMYIYIYIHIIMYMCVYIYIYIERERERLSRGGGAFRAPSQGAESGYLLIYNIRLMLILTIIL